VILYPKLVGGWTMSAAAVGVFRFRVMGFMPGDCRRAPGRLEAPPLDNDEVKARSRRSQRRRARALGIRRDRRP
jgi:hypothetical protein